MSARFRASVLAMFAFALFAFAGSASAATNLIANPGLEASTTVATLPDNWIVGGFGTNTVSHNYAPAYGHAGKGVNVTVTAYTDGDAKWYFSPVDVQENAFYTFSDYYKSNVASKVVAMFTKPNGDVLNVTLATLPAAADWTQTVQTFTPPLGYASTTVFHLIEGVGSLSTDDYSLELTAPAADNQFDNGMVSLTFDDGWTSQYNNAFPALVAANFKATFYLIGKAIKGASIIDLFQDANATADMQTVAAPTSKTWSPLYTSDITTYTFKDTYSASTTSTVEVTYSTGNHTATTTLVSDMLVSGDAKSATFSFTLPAQGTFDPGISIKHTSTGGLIASNPSLTFDATGYMTPAMMLDLQNHQIEIGGHTENHCNLVFLAAPGSNSTDPNTCAFPEAGLTWQGDIDNGYTSLVNNGATSVHNFAYPNGANNTEIRDYIKNHGLFGSARTVAEGYNTKQSDKMALKVQVVDINSTALQVQGWIDTALSTKTWLILVFHQIDTPPVLKNGEDGGTTPEIFQDIVNYLKLKPAGTVKTVAEALALMPNPVPADTTAPVITLLGSATNSIVVGTAYTDAGATASDNKDGNITANIVVTGSVNTAAAGTYVLHYNVSDAAGNAAAEVTREVTVTAVPVTPPSSGGQAPAGGNGSGGGGGGGIVGSGPLSLGYVYVNPTGPITTTPGTGSVLGAATCFIFTKNLTVGSTGAEVTALQTRLAAEGLFSAGATGYFGNVTKASVMAYQKKNGIEALGNTGPKTRAALNATCQATPAAPAATGAGSVLGTSTFVFTQNLSLGSTGEEVNELQKVLIGLGFLKVAAPTGYFGSLTKVAVADYQMSRGIEAVGSVGPKTRAALNGNVAAVSAEK